MQNAKNCDVPAINLNVPHNYYSSMKLFSDLYLKFYTSAKSFFLCKQK